MVIALLGVAVVFAVFQLGKKLHHYAAHGTGAVWP